jgi:hypothetical protein
LMYRTHCQRILDTVISANFDEVMLIIIELIHIYRYKAATFFFLNFQLVDKISGYIISLNSCIVVLNKSE